MTRYGSSLRLVVTSDGVKVGVVVGVGVIRELKTYSENRKSEADKEAVSAEDLQLRIDTSLS